MTELVKTKYKSNALPHIQPIGATFFVTFRLFDTLPKSYLNKFKEDRNLKIAFLKREKPIGYQNKIANEQKKYFKIYDEALDKMHNNIRFLEHPNIAKETIKQLHKYDGKWYDLIAYCIMPNHVHFLIDTRLQLEKFNFDDEVIIKNYTPLYKIIQRIKGASARHSNLLLDREGISFWQRDYFDYFIRNNQEFQRIMAYILENPVKANLVKNWEDFPHSYVKMVGEN